MDGPEDRQRDRRSSTGDRLHGPGRLGVAALVLALHLAVGALLVRAFAPQWIAPVARQTGDGLSLVVVTPTPPAPEPAPSPQPRRAMPEPEGAAAPAGRKAKPREVAAPVPKVDLAPSPAPKVAGTGAANASGAREVGDGTGAAGTGQGTGAGAGGSGSGGGGGVAAKAVKIAGDINSARDYPRASRDLRIGGDVIIALTVGTDGRVRDCRISRPSRDPEADRITCRLATERFRFRPATDAAGRPVESVYGWRQRWFYPGTD